MKKSYLLLLFLVVLMYGCSNGVKETPTAKAEDAEKIVTNDQERQKQVIDRQLYEKLSEAVETLGYTYDMHTFAENEHDRGVLYAELVDFDNDGVNEVYTFMKGIDYPLSAYPHRNKDNYIQEIWTGNPNGEDALLSFSSEIDKLVCSACDMNVSLVKGKDGRTFVKMFSHQMSQGIANNNIWVYAKDPKKSEMDLVVSGNFGHNNEGDLFYTLNDEETDRVKFDEEFAQYDGEERPILISNFAEKNYGFDASSPATIVGKTLATLSPSVNNIVGKEELLEKDKKKEIVEALDEFSSMRSINHHDPQIVMSLVLDVVQKYNIDHEYSENGEMVFDGAIVQAKYKEVFGVDLAIDSMNFPSRDSQGIVTYELGKFYIYPTGFYFDSIHRNYQDVYKVSNDVYYVTFLDSEFNSLDYSLTKDVTVTSEEMFKKDIASWPMDARELLKPNIQRYAVVKYVDGEPKVQYMGVQNLTDNQLQTF